MISKNCALRIVESCFIPKTRMWENAPDISNMSMCIYLPSILWKMEYCDETHAYGHVPEREMAGIHTAYSTNKKGLLCWCQNKSTNTPPQQAKKAHTVLYQACFIVCVYCCLHGRKKFFNTHRLGGNFSFHKKAKQQKNVSIVINMFNSVLFVVDLHFSCDLNNKTKETMNICVWTTMEECLWNGFSNGCCTTTKKWWTIFANQIDGKELLLTSWSEKPFNGNKFRIFVPLLIYCVEPKRNKTHRKIVKSKAYTIYLP